MRGEGKSKENEESRKRGKERKVRSGEGKKVKGVRGDEEMKK